MHNCTRKRHTRTTTMGRLLRCICRVSLSPLCSCLPPCVDDYSLDEPWYYTMEPNHPKVREKLRQTTPEEFTKRNIFCGNRVFSNKYEKEIDTIPHKKRATKASVALFVIPYLECHPIYLSRLLQKYRTFPSTFFKDAVYFFQRTKKRGVQDEGT